MSKSGVDDQVEATRRGGRYQDFGKVGEGSSQSYEKLKRLKLEKLGTGNASEPLAGMSVLDIGCNEGYFCWQALNLGATRVVGLDQGEKVIASARENIPGAEFMNTTWWNLPDEQFDIILFLSASHYERQQKRLFQRLREHLKPGGTLVLECGLSEGTGTRYWGTAKRHDGVFRYPSLDLLRYDLLKEWSVRMVGPSVPQKGDPKKRFVFHCSPESATGILITGQSRSGKSSLGFELKRRDIPTYTTDQLLRDMARSKRGEWTATSQGLVERFGVESEKIDLHAVARYVVANGYASEVAELIAMEVPVEAQVFNVEGDLLRFREVREALIAELELRGVRVWVMEPSGETPDKTGTQAE